MSDPLVSPPASPPFPAGQHLPHLVVMGVSGCGKSSLGGALARHLAWPLIEGDDFHPPENKAKMVGGVPLTDADRSGWLALLGQQLAAHPAGAVLTCSALKRVYREQLRQARPGLCFVHLVLDQPTALARVAARAGEHLFPPSLVASQFATLESPAGEAGVLSLPATQPLPALMAAVLQWLPSQAAKSLDTEAR